MNIDYIRAKCKMLHGATPPERDEIFGKIGVCAGLISAQQVNIPPQKLDEVQKWLQANAEKLQLQLPKLPGSTSPPISPKPLPVLKEQLNQI